MKDENKLKGEHKSEEDARREVRNPRNHSILAAEVADDLARDEEKIQVKMLPWSSHGATPRLCALTSHQR
jgi:hypothetical protein